MPGHISPQLPAHLARLLDLPVGTFVQGGRYILTSRTYQAGDRPWAVLFTTDGQRAEIDNPCSCSEAERPRVDAPDLPRWRYVERNGNDRKGATCPKCRSVRPLKYRKMTTTTEALPNNTFRIVATGGDRSWHPAEIHGAARKVAQRTGWDCVRIVNHEWHHPEECTTSVVVGTGWLHAHEKGDPVILPVIDVFPPAGTARVGRHAIRSSATVDLWWDGSRWRVDGLDFAGVPFMSHDKAERLGDNGQPAEELDLADLARQLLDQSRQQTEQAEQDRSAAVKEYRHRSRLLRRLDAKPATKRTTLAIGEHRRALADLAAKRLTEELVYLLELEARTARAIEEHDREGLDHERLTAQLRHLAEDVRKVMTGRHRVISPVPAGTPRLLRPTERAVLEARDPKFIGAPPRLEDLGPYQECTCGQPVDAHEVDGRRVTVREFHRRNDLGAGDAGDRYYDDEITVSAGSAELRPWPLPSA